MTHQLAHPFSVRFVLREARLIVPWGEPPDLSLGWFGLSDGAFCIETSDGLLLDYRDEHDDGLDVSWCTYAVCRLWEDMLGWQPHALEVVPSDVLTRFLPWLDSPASLEPPVDDEQAEAWFDVQNWWGDRQLDLGYLRNAPFLHAWRDGDMVHVRWRCREPLPAMCPFTVWRSQSRVPAAAFSTAINNFSRDFLAQMRTRSQAILDNGWTGATCTIDPAGLLREQEDRERIAAHAYTPPKTDWDNVRRMLDTLGL